ncbi:hypothetical protein Ndes2526B_g00520 [Nannochloris sp. 'desiccata']|nr:putative Uracil phosphoribosyltransferase [Chlorella desiccata (nom. nud.)]
MHATKTMPPSTLLRGTQITWQTSFKRPLGSNISPSHRHRLHIFAAAPKMNAKTMLVYVPPHPLVAHWVAVMRNTASPSPIFRSAAAELGRILLYEAVREFLPTLQGQVETPVGVAEVTFVDPTKPVKVVPVLRAGLVLLENAATVLPASQTFHVGYARDEDTLESRCYLNKLPEKLSGDDLIVVSDCMLATGGTMVQVLTDLINRGADSSNIRIISAIAAPPALNKLNEAFPGLKIYTGIIDAELNDKGYIVPGMGDAGDRAFGNR